MRGRFVVLEGGDGTGKSTQAGLLAGWARGRGLDVVVTHEPGGTPAGARMRAILLDPATGHLAPRAEALLFAADKAQHVEEVIAPALGRGALVISDRYTDSSLAYQGAGRVIDPADAAWVVSWATGGLRPDLTVVLDVDPAAAVGEKVSHDRMEQEGAEFHARVRARFLELAAADPDRYLVLPARNSREWIHAAVVARFEALGG